MDPRVKLIATALFVLLVVLTPDGRFTSFFMYLAMLAIVIVAARLPLTYILLRSLTILPFAIAVSVFVPFITPGPVVHELSVGPIDAVITSTGLIKFASLGLRALTSFFATIILVSSTRFGDIMCAARSLGMPSKIVAVMSFMYRYLFIIIDEAAHMMLARDLRSCSVKKTGILSASGGIIGALFVRSFEHAERLYTSMLLRGYTGTSITLRPMQVTAVDITVAGVFIALAFTGFIAGGKLYV